jgi:hypothetical protein
MPKRPVLCRKCGKLFTSYMPNALWCPACRPKVVYRPKVGELKKVCKNCEKPFKTHQSKAMFCSVNCRNAFNNVPVSVIKKCAWCGKQFVTTTANRLYCNDTCYRLNKIKRLEEHRNAESGTPRFE